MRRGERGEEKGEIRGGEGGGRGEGVYFETEPETLLHVGTGAAVAIENTAGWTDTVVWNPHTTLPGDDKNVWKKFVCVESACVSKPVVLETAKVWKAETNLSIVNL